VLDALGERWASELCHADYMSPGYFSSEAQNSTRWLYYQTKTQGQNTITNDGVNQLVDAVPHTTFATTGDVQPNSTHPANKKSAVYWTANLTTSYNGTNIQRGIRLLKERTQVLIQDEVTDATTQSQWRMHTYASIKYSKKNTVAGKLRCRYALIKLTSEQ
jgi:hypothetical protein